MTKKEMFAQVIEIVKASEVENVDELVEKLEHEVEILSKKRSSTNSKAKAETEARAELAYAELAKMEEPVTITEFLALTGDEEVASWTNQRVSALFRKLGDRVVKEMRGKKAYFSVA